MSPQNSKLSEIIQLPVEPKSAKNTHASEEVLSIFFWRGGRDFKRKCQQKPPELESGGSADRLGTNFFGFPIQK